MTRIYYSPLSGFFYFKFPRKNKYYFSLDGEWQSIEFNGDFTSKHLELEAVF